MEWVAWKGDLLNNFSVQSTAHVFQYDRGCIFPMQDLAIWKIIIELVAKLSYSVVSCYSSIIYTQYSTRIYMTK